MIKFKKFAPVIILFMVAACAMPATRTYNIFLPLENLTGDRSAPASMTVSVDAEDHLLQPYIVYRSSPYKFRILQYSKWEASPRKMVKEGFRNAFFLTGTFNNVKIAGIQQKGSYFLKVNLKRFERVKEGDELYGLVEMDLKLWSPGGEEVYFKTISRKERLSDSDFAGLAKHLSALFKEVVEEVRVDIIQIVEAGSK